MSGVVTIRQMRIFMQIPRDEIRRVEREPIYPDVNTMRGRYDMPDPDRTRFVIDLIHTKMTLIVANRDTWKDAQVYDQLFADITSEIDIDIRWTFDGKVWTRTENAR